MMIVTTGAGQDGERGLARQRRGPRLNLKYGVNFYFSTFGDNIITIVKEACLPIYIKGVWQESAGDQENLNHGQ